MCLDPGPAQGKNTGKATKMAQTRVPFSRLVAQEAGVAMPGARTYNAYLPLFASFRHVRARARHATSAWRDALWTM